MKKKMRLNKKSIVCSFIILCLGISGLFIYLKNNSQKDINNSEIYYKPLNDNLIIENKNNMDIVKNELIFENDKLSKKEINDMIKKINGKVVGYIDVTHTYQIEFDEKITEKELYTIKDQLEKNKKIKNVSENLIINLDDNSITYPKDKKWKKEWSTVADGGNWGLEAIQCPEAWNYINKEYSKTETVDVGIFERNGFNENHEDLKDNIGSILGNDLSNDSKENKEHGTHVAGIIGATHNNIGISGVAENVRLDYYALNGAKKYSTIMAFKIGLTHLMIQAKNNNQTAIINISLSLEKSIVFGASRGNEIAINYINNLNTYLSEYLNIMLNNGYDFLLVKSAGNANDDDFLKVDFNEAFANETKYGYVLYNSEKDSEEYKKYNELYKIYENEFDSRLDSGGAFAQYDIFSGIDYSRALEDRIIVVGALQNDGNNQYSISSYSQIGREVDILAPGTNIESTINEKQYERKSGTSMAAPFVSGVAAQVLSIEKNIPGNVLKDILTESTTNTYDIKGGFYFTLENRLVLVPYEVSMLNSYNAVKLAKKYHNNKSEKEIYKDLLAKYKKAADNRFSDKQLWDELGLTNDYLNQSNSLGNKTALYYYYKDLNDDNVKELLIGTNIDDDTYIVKIWSYYLGKIRDLSFDGLRYLGNDNIAIGEKDDDVVKYFYKKLEKNCKWEDVEDIKYDNTFFNIKWKKLCDINFDNNIHTQEGFYFGQRLDYDEKCLAEFYCELSQREGGLEIIIYGINGKDYAINGNMRFPYITDKILISINENISEEFLWNNSLGSYGTGQVEIISEKQIRLTMKTSRYGDGFNYCDCRGLDLNYVTSDEIKDSIENIKSEVNHE